MKYYQLFQLELKDKSIEIEGKINEILPPLLKEIFQSIRDRMCEYDIKIDVTFIENSEEGTYRMLILITGNLNMTFEEKLKLEDEIDEIIAKIFESWREKVKSEIDKSIIDYIDLLIGVLIQDQSKVIEIEIEKSDLEDQMDKLIKLFGDTDKAKEIKENI
ncbi:MAG: hypothetical protein DRP01_07255, partial [Archaeoglobales archaeon]